MAKNVFKAKKIAATCSSHKMTKVQELGAGEPQ
jgi:hypothetical protein